MLRRLAELDLLRRVAVISTVSGGSIVAAHYYLLLKEAMAVRTLTDADYVKLVEKVEQDFRSGVAKNLRTRLFANPLASIVLFVTGGSLGRRMARLYTRLLFRNALAALCAENLLARQPTKEVLREGPMLHNVKFTLFDENQNTKLKADLETYNADSEHNCVPKIILNATCLNTACAFRFSIAEIGDPQLGSLRFDEIERVLRCKELFESLPTRVTPFEGVGKLVDDKGKGKGQNLPELPQPSHLFWFHACTLALSEETSAATPINDEPARFRDARARFGIKNGAVAFFFQDWATSKALVTAQFEELRRAKLSAWWLHQIAKADEKRGGRTKDQWLDEFWSAIDDIDPALRKRLEEKFGRDDGELRDLIMDLYYLRSGVAFAHSARNVMPQISLSHAVAASANFPPVFAPFRIEGLYDARHCASSLALTDGGVFDNQGIEALRAEDCTDIIASDAGGLLSVESNPSRLRGPMMGRIVGTLMSNLRSYQLGSLREEGRVSKGIEKLTPADDIEKLHARYRVQSIALFHMTSNPNDAVVPDALPEHPLASTIARMRTDLDIFCDVEIDALIYQGYQLADRFVRKYTLQSPLPDVSPSIAIDTRMSAYAAGFEVREKRSDAVLKASHQRAGRLMAIYPGQFIMIDASVIVALVALLFYTRWSILSVTRPIGSSVHRVIAFPFTLPPVHALLSMSYGTAALVILIAAVATMRFIPVHVRARWPIPARNWLWLVYGFPLLLVLFAGLVGGFILLVVTPLVRYVGRR